MRKSFLVLAFFWFFLLLAWGVFHFFLSDGLSANPQHVRGSDNVAVSGYHNGNGNFVLWSSGRITSLKGEILNESDQYVLDSECRLPKLSKGQCVGAAQVAVDVFVNSRGSYVIFADGSVRRPRNKDAGAGSDSQKMVAGSLLPYTPSFPNLGGEDFRPDSGFTRQIYYNAGISRLEITFDEPFTHAPVVLLSSMPVAESMGTFSELDCKLISVSNKSFIVELGKKRKGGYFLAVGN